MSKDMSTNPIEDLRHLESPVTEQEWASILQDKRYTQKFGRKPGLSPKGRAAIVAGVVVALIAIPILVKTLSQKPATAVQKTEQKTETTVSQDINSSSAATEPTSAIHSPEAKASSSSPAKVESTDRAAMQERSTMTSAIAARDQNIETGQSYETKDIPTIPEKTSSTIVQTPPSVKTPVVTEQKKPVLNPKQAEAEDTNAETSPKSEPETEPEITETDQFFIPSAFTPNGDGLNDLFYVKANFEPQNFEITIMTRNGDLLFHSRDMNIGWDGRLHGSILPHGMYVYIIKYKDSQGKEQKKQGQILLIP